jgi:hypothetical protein
LSLGNNIIEVAYRGIFAAGTVLSMVSVLGCMPPMVTPTNSDAMIRPAPEPTLCDLGPIRVRKGDVLTLDTADQIIKHNERGQKVCGWKS